MEEKILELIQKNAAGSTEYITDGLYHKIAAKEIADIFRKFTEWHYSLAEYKRDDNKKEYFIPKSKEDESEGEWMLFTLNELFNYWYDNVKDK